MPTLPSQSRPSLAVSGSFEPGTSNYNVDGLSKRMKESILNGNFCIDDPWEDYLILNSEDPFLVLFLSFDDYLSCSDDTVDRHYKEIKKFLDRILINFSSGIDFKSNYPLLNPELAMTKIKEARSRLGTKSGRESVYFEIIGRIRAEGKKDLDTLLEALLIDGVLTPDESRHYITRALTHRYTEPEALEQLEERLSTLGYLPAKPLLPGQSLADKILSTAWITPGKYKDSRSIHDNSSEAKLDSKHSFINIPDSFVSAVQKVARESDLSNVEKTVDFFGMVFLQKLNEKVQE